MRDADYEREKKRIARIFDRWIGPLGLKWWRITFRWSDEPKRGDQAVKEHLRLDAASNWECFMETSSDYYYRTAYITVYVPAVAGLSLDEELENVVLHELCHILVNPMHHGERQREEELVCSTLASTLKWAFEFGQRSGRAKQK